MIDALVADIQNANFDWDAQFDAWAKRLFAFQFEHNAPYRNFCDGRGVSPDTVSGYRDIPSVPTDVFKHVSLTTSQGEPERVFRTSGTTQGARGEHIFASLAAYAASIAPPFKAHMMPERVRMPIAALAPAPGDLADSSLSYWLGELLTKFGTPFRSGFFIEKTEDAELDFDFDGIVEWLDLAKGPVFLIGTAFAFVEFFDAVDKTWSLPAGSRVLETGGLKGRTREVSRDELYGLFDQRLGIEPSHCLSEYSMTELSSQAYSNALSANVSWDQSSFVTPPWARVEIVNPLTMEIDDAPDARGLICWYDLANISSVVAVQTSDIGVRTPDGFRLEGRASDSELRGCSLTIEEIVEG